MQNEMKITVIATGFESRKSENVHNMPARQTTAGGGSLNSAQPRINTPSSGSAPLRTEADLEIPTFMRKKAD
jgi:hypothetical protein